MSTKLLVLVVALGIVSVADAEDKGNHNELIVFQWKPGNGEILKATTTFDGLSVVASGVTLTVSDELGESNVVPHVGSVHEYIACRQGVLSIDKHGKLIRYSVDRNGFDAVPIAAGSRRVVFAAFVPFHGDIRILVITDISAAVYSLDGKRIGEAARGPSGWQSTLAMVNRESIMFRGITRTGKWVGKTLAKADIRPER